MSDLQTQGHELKCGRHSAMQVKKAKLRDLLEIFWGMHLFCQDSRSSCMYCCCVFFGLGWPCGLALRLCFFVVCGGLVGQLCCCVFSLFGAAMWASVVVVVVVVEFVFLFL